MKLTAPRRREETENIIPLINIVFLLLIFFMLTGVLSAPDLFEVTPPESAATTEAAPDAEILLATDGRLAVDGEPASLEDLPALLEGRTEGEVALRADGDVPAHHLMAVMDALRTAGVASVSLVTLQAEDR